MAAHGFAKIFKKNSEEEREHAFKLVDYQNMRGGRVVFQDIAKPTKVEWASAQEAVEAALELEKTVNQVFTVKDFVSHKFEDNPMLICA